MKKINKKQLVVVLGLISYVAGGLIVVVFNLETFIKILQSQINLFIPILKTYIPILIFGIFLIYLLRDKNK
jgi:hypothetical protein